MSNISRPHEKTLLVVPWMEGRGGVMTVVQDLARYLRSQGHEVVFFYPGKAVLLQRVVTPLGIRGVQLRVTVPFGKPRPLRSTLAFPLLFPIVLLQLIWFLRRERIRIVNIHYPMDSFFYFAICRRLLSFRLATSVHGSDMFDPRGRPRGRYSHPLKYLIHTSDMIVLPSEAYRKRLLNVFPDVEGKTVLIPNGVDSALFNSSLPQPNREHSRYILCIASLVEWKGVDVLLRASQPLLVGDPSLGLVIVGSGVLRSELESLAASLGISSQTQFAGTKSASDVAALLRGCEVFALPSRADNCPLVIMEAMASRKPVVASNVGGIPEIIENEKSGILVEPDNPEALSEALNRVLSSTQLQTTLAENGYLRINERFSFQRTASAYTAAFESLLGKEHELSTVA